MNNGQELNKKRNLVIRNVRDLHVVSRVTVSSPTTSSSRAMNTQGVGLDIQARHPMQHVQKKKIIITANCVDDDAQKHKLLTKFLFIFFLQNKLNGVERKTVILVKSRPVRTP